MCAIKEWAVARAQLKIDAWTWTSYPCKPEVTYECTLEPRIVKLFNSQQEATDYLTQHSDELCTSDSLVSVIKVKDITKIKNRPRY